MRWICRALLLVGLGAGATVRAQAPAASQKDDALVTYFAGRWSCAGRFANGKPIASEVRFEPVLEGKWLRYSHADRPPNHYQAEAMWRVDARSGGFVSVMEDNFGGVRLFRSAGWRDSTIVLESAPLLGDSTRHERFSYSAESPDRFRMEYRVSRDGKAWKLGDALECERES
jgi:hypothetical protein